MRILFFVFFGFYIAQAAIPNVINYQGVFVDSTGKGKAISDALIFEIYAAQAGGSPVWTETHSVISATGVFSVVLGSKTPIPDSLINKNDELYLETRKGAQTSGERTKITGVFYALRANNADSARTAGRAEIADSARVALSSTTAQTAASAVVADSSRVAYTVINDLDPDSVRAASKADVSTSSTTSSFGDSSRIAFMALSSTIADSSRASRNSDTATYAHVAGVADSARVSGNPVDSFWQKSGDSLYYLDGNVGIGVTDPIEKLEVRGTISAKGQGGGSFKIDDTNNTLVSEFDLLGIGSRFQDNFSIRTNNQPRLTVYGVGGIRLETSTTPLTGNGSLWFDGTHMRIRLNSTDYYFSLQTTAPY